MSFRFLISAVSKSPDWRTCSLAQHRPTGGSVPYPGLAVLNTMNYRVKVLVCIGAVDDHGYTWRPYWSQCH